MAPRVSIRSSLGTTDSRPRNSSERLSRHHGQVAVSAKPVHCCSFVHLQHHAHNVLLYGTRHQRCFEVEDPKRAEGRRHELGRDEPLCAFGHEARCDSSISAMGREDRAERADSILEKDQRFSICPWRSVSAVERVCDFLPACLKRQEETTQTPMILQRIRK